MYFGDFKTWRNVSMHRGGEYRECDHQERVKCSQYARFVLVGIGALSGARLSKTLCPHHALHCIRKMRHIRSNP